MLIFNTLSQIRCGRYVTDDSSLPYETLARMSAAPTGPPGTGARGGGRC